MSQDVRSLNPPDYRRSEREAAFRQYDEMVCSVLSELKSAMFPRTYEVDKHKAGDWYLSPPDHIMGISLVSVKLRFDSSNRPVGFRVTNYVDWTPVEECELSSHGLQKAVRRLFPRYERA